MFQGERLAYPRLVELILHDIQAELVAHGTAALEAPLVDDLPRGRAPKGAGRSLKRDVDWFYRAVVLRETVYGIAKANLGKGGQNHSVVQNAISRTKVSRPAAMYWRCAKRHVA